MEIETRNLKHINGLPSISVIVPVYNAEKTLRQCVDSILRQEFKNFELLLINDGSKDASTAICEEYARKDDRVRVFHKENGGVSSARNLGLNHAQGEWITFIDSDDYITVGYFEGVEGIAEDVIIKGYCKFNNSGVIGKKTVKELSRFSHMKDFLNQFITDSLLRCPWAKFYKKSLIGDLLFLTDMKIGEDAYFVFMYLAKCKSFAVLPRGEYMVRLAEEPDEVKYAISVDYAVRSLQYLKEAYEGLVKVHHIDRSLFLHYIGYFKRISKSDWHNEKSKWYGNKDVQLLYNYVLPSLPINHKIRLLLARILRK